MSSRSANTIVIVTDNLQHATAAANATAFVFVFDGEPFEHGQRTGMCTDPKDEPTERDVSERFG